MPVPLGRRREHTKPFQVVGIRREMSRLVRSCAIAHYLRLHNFGALRHEVKCRYFSSPELLCGFRPCALWSFRDGVPGFISAGSRASTSVGCALSRAKVGAILSVRSPSTCADVVVQRSPNLFFSNKSDFSFVLEQGLFAIAQLWCVTTIKTA